MGFYWFIASRYELKFFKDRKFSSFILVCIGWDKYWSLNHLIGMDVLEKLSQSGLNFEGTDDIPPLCEKISAVI